MLSKQFVGIGGMPVTTRCTTIPVQIRRFGNVLHLPVEFTDSPTVDVLLGQEIFFDAYHIHFLKDDHLFEILPSRAFWRMEPLHDALRRR